jgi:hypothetical protein
MSVKEVMRACVRGDLLRRKMVLLALAKGDDEAVLEAPGNTMAIMR